jgi:D-aminoacyl-tRNA deacylase
MRAVIQRVSHATVTIGERVKGAIQSGLLVLLAIEESDTAEDIEWLSGKIVRLRIFDDENGVMNRSVQEANGGILLVSQFTLFASTKKGNRPSYTRSARPEIAIPIFEKFISRLTQDFGKPIQTGEFGADMQVNLTNHYRFEVARVINSPVQRKPARFRWSPGKTRSRNFGFVGTCRRTKFSLSQTDWRHCL